MMDDLISISECGLKTTMANSYIRFKSLSKKLQFGSEKCKKMHVGKVKEEYKCQPLFVDKHLLKIQEYLRLKTSAMVRMSWKTRKKKSILGI